VTAGAGVTPVALSDFGALDDEQAAAVRTVAAKIPNIKVFDTKADIIHIPSVVEG
jgi:hypothetical protein